jgi:hypothetical protein
VPKGSSEGEALCALPASLPDHNYGGEVVTARSGGQEASIIIPLMNTGHKRFKIKGIYIINA